MQGLGLQKVPHGEEFVVAKLSQVELYYIYRRAKSKGQIKPKDLCDILFMLTKRFAFITPKSVCSFFGNDFRGDEK